MYFRSIDGQNNLMKKIPDKYYMYLSAFSAVLTALSQTTYTWYLSLFCLSPLFLGLFYQPRISFMKSVTVFMLTYHGIMCGFLMTLYDYLDLPAAVMSIICLIAAAALAALQSAVMTAAVYPSVAADIKSRAVRIIVFSVCFSLGQYFLEIIPYLSFPWARLENALAYQPVLLQISALLGGGAAGTVILLLNGMFACLLDALFHKNVRKMLKNSAALLVCFSALTVCGAAYMLSKDTEKTINVTAVQGPHEGLEKNSQSAEEAAVEYSHILSGLTDDTDLVLPPETAVSDELTKRLTDILSQSTDSQTSIVTGCIYEQDGKRYNCMSPIGESGSRHLKQVLVPFGEFIPFADVDGFTSLTASDRGDCITVGGHRFAASICIESIYSSLLSGQIADGGEMILISTNDSWFKNSFAREVQFRHSIIRAVEYDRSIVRSGNCGISAVIDRNGRIIAAEYGKGAAAVTASAELSHTRTPYSVIGNIFQLPALLFVIWYYTVWLTEKLLDTAKIRKRYFSRKIFSE